MAHASWLIRVTTQLSDRAGCPIGRHSRRIEAHHAGMTEHGGTVLMKPNRRSDAGPNPGEGAGAGFQVLRGAHRTQHHSGTRQHIRRHTFPLG
jgi:hypothetical protein